MAYASVASLLQTIDLVNYHRDSSVSSRFKDQITSLHKHASFLQSFLEDSPKRANNWEETIREVTDRAEEIIDLLVSDSLLKKWSKSELHHGLDELEKVTEEMESTVGRVKGRRSTKAMTAADKELMEIITLIREGSPMRETIAVVGMGGVGKTSLARNAYNHPSIVEHFDIRAWSTVPVEYSGRGVILDLLRCMNIETVSDSDDTLMESLHRSLWGKRYLIVIDDIWSIEAWDMVRPAFPDNGNGSRILLTTRLFELADSAHIVHHMNVLDEHKSWDMLRELIFKGDPCPSQLEHFGKTIAKRCQGIPLSIAVVSGILASDQTEATWEDVSENLSDVSEADFVLSQILSLSYTHLPHHLRPCILYLGIFPEGGEIHVSKLVKLWVAEGFLNESGSKSFGVVGEECVEELVRRRLVSVSKRKSDGSIKSIAVHDLMRDLCLRQASIDNFIDVSRFGWYYQDRQAAAMKERQWCRRVSCSNYSHDFLKGVYESTIRTIMLYFSYGGKYVRQSIGNVRLLRILDLSNAYDYDLPEEVFQLFHLRYLAFYCGFCISEAISNLQNLQTLIICPRYWTVLDIPEGIWRMPQLRHLFNFSFKLPSLGGGENSPLENLETLSTIVDFVCSRENLKMIPNVKKLALLYTEKLRDVEEDYELHNLIYLNKLEILKIEMELSFGEEHKMSTSFPPSLKKLNLCGLQLPWEDMKFVGSLPNLEVLKLRKHACVGETWETNEGGFSRLKYLLIEESNLENWRSETSHFPKLKTLVLHSCLHLSKVPYEMAEIPTLQLMELDTKNQYLLDSAKQIQEYRQSLGDDGLQILVV